jgi:hypothetical protein
MTTERSSDERIARLETSVEAIHSEFLEVRSSLAAIQNTLAKSRETNWSVIFAGVAIIGATYAAAIRPIDRYIERQQSVSVELAKAVSAKDIIIGELRNKMTQGTSEIGSIRKELDLIRKEGSPITDKRMNLIANGGLRIGGGHH